MKQSIRNIATFLREKTKWWTVVAAVIAGLVLGYVFRGPWAPGGQPPSAAAGPAEPAQGEKEKAVQWWTCSMHPQIKLPKEGLCPICNMKLIPLESTEAQGRAMRELTVSENARKLMEIETSPVERKLVEAQIRMVGKIDYDETRLKYITAWIPGRLDRLYVDYTGVPVKKGEHMVSLYSPELLAAQEELIQALESVRALKDGDSGVVRTTSEATVAATREKLRLLGLTAEQITEIEETGRASDHLTIYSPSAGIVVHKNAQEGMYVKTGTRIYTIADLSVV